MELGSNIVCGESSTQQSSQVPEVAKLANELEKKIIILGRAVHRIHFSNMMKGEVKIAKQYVIIVKVLEGKINAPTLKAGLDVEWFSCKIM